jgi:hypothetical protein
VPLVSGEEGPGRWLLDNHAGGPGSGRTRAWTHVEGHAASVMRQQNISRAELFINQVPCGPTGAAKCRNVLYKLLPTGGILDVHYPKDDGTVGTWRFVGGRKGWTEVR